jgi:Aspartyl protease
MKIGARQLDSQRAEARRHKLSSWSGLSRGSGLRTAALLIAFTSTCSGSSAARDRESTNGTEVPFELYNGNLIIVKATIGTIKNVNMILDTGTSPSAISRELAERLKLRGTTESLQTLSGTIQTQSLLLPSIQIGPLAASPIRVVVQDLSFMERSLGISFGGIAGLDILSSGSFTIDYRRKKIVFGPIAASEKTVRFETQEPFLTVKAMIEGQAVRLLVDSGTWGLLLYRNRLQTTQQQVHFDSSVSISSPGGMTHVRWLRALVLLGKDNLGVLNVAIVDINSDTQNDFDGLLGFAKMGFRKVSFDFENGVFGWE